MKVVKRLKLMRWGRARVGAVNRASWCWRRVVKLAVGERNRVVTHFLNSSSDFAIIS